MSLSPNTLQYAHLAESDQPRLLALMRQIYPPVYAYLWPDDGEWYLNSQYGVDNFRIELADPRADYRFVQIGDLPVGIVRTVTNMASPDHPDRSATKLHRLYLDPVYQGQGIGRRVIEDTVADCQAHGADYLWLEAMDSAEASLAFYHRLGFQRGGHFILDMPKMYPAYRGMWRMYRELSV